MRRSAHHKSAQLLITEAYRRIALRAGTNKAKVAAARHLLRMIYYMLKRNQSYDSYERRGTG